MIHIDFAIVRARISILDVLELLDYVPVRCSDYQWRSPCPLGCCRSDRVFAAYLDSNRAYCFHCRWSGNPLELWAVTQNLPFYSSVVDLCDRLQIEIPRLSRP